MLFEIAVLVALLVLVGLGIANLNKPCHVEYQDRYVTTSSCSKCKERKREEEREEEREEQRKEAEKQATLEHYQRKYDVIETRILKGDIPEYDFSVEEGLFRSREHKICVPVNAIESIDVIDSGGCPTYSSGVFGYGELRPHKHLAVIRVTLKSGNHKEVKCWAPEVDFVFEDMQETWARGRRMS